MNISLFEFAVIQQPKYDKNGEVIDEGRLVVEPTSLLAKSQEQAQMKAVRAIPAEYMDDLDRLSVVVRPFDSQQSPQANLLKGTGGMTFTTNTSNTTSPLWTYTYASPSVNTTYTNASTILDSRFEE